MSRALLPALLLAPLLGGCAGGDGALEASVDDALDYAVDRPQRIVTAPRAGPEDVVALPLGHARVRLFFREHPPAWRSTPRPRLATAVVGAGPLPLATDGVAPPREAFEPLGLDLVPGAEPGSGRLYVIDRAGQSVWLARLSGGSVSAWRRIGPTASDALSAANDLAAADGAVYVTRFDRRGGLWRDPDWRGIARIDADDTVSLLAPGLQGANGIVADRRTGRLVVSDYWGRALLVMQRTEDGQLATIDRLPLAIHPDNLSDDGERILVAGQESWVRTALNLYMPWWRSPSRVYAVAKPVSAASRVRLLWADDGRHAASVSVAVPVPGRRIVLGQITAPDLLVIADSNPPR